MKNQNLLIYDYDILYDILNELKDKLPFYIIKLTKKNLNKLNEFQHKNYLIITQRKIVNTSHQIILDKLPINILSFVEKLNIKFLKLNFSEKSKIKIGNYMFDLNSREMINQNKKLKLTEKEINSIIFIFKAKEPVNVRELQVKVWGYLIDAETHTVETHIYRLRKKIINIFSDNNFLISKKNGYRIV